VKLLKTAQVPIEQLQPYPGNPRNGDVDAIAESLAVHDQYRAIVVWAVNPTTRAEPMQVLAGNHTFLAAHQLERPKVLCHLIECDDDEARRICLVDNRTNDLAGYDSQQLADLLKDLEGDFSGTGWDQDGLDRLLKQIATDEAQQLDPQQEATLTCPKCGHEAPSGKFRPES
jgi:ParB-like chromosome segregation protein Spo0J